MDTYGDTDWHIFLKQKIRQDEMMKMLQREEQRFMNELEEDIYKDAERKYQDTRINLRVSVSDALVVFAKH